jgi:hypothetical protein
MASVVFGYGRGVEVARGGGLAKEKGRTSKARKRMRALIVKLMRLNERELNERTRRKLQWKNGHEEEKEMIG